MAHKHADFHAESSHVAAAQAVKEVGPANPSSRNASSAALIDFRDRSVRQNRIHATAVQNFANVSNAIGPAKNDRSLRVQQQLC